MADHKATLERMRQGLLEYKDSGRVPYSNPDEMFDRSWRDEPKTAHGDTSVLDEPFIPGDLIIALNDLYDCGDCVMMASEKARVLHAVDVGPRTVLTLVRDWEPHTEIEIVWPCMIERVSRDLAWERSYDEERYTLKTETGTDPGPTDSNSHV